MSASPRPAHASSWIPSMPPASLRTEGRTLPQPSMFGWRNPHARSPPLTVVVKIRLDALVARRLPSCLERDRTHIREEHLFVNAREDLDGLFQRQPFDGLDIVHRLAHGPADDSHMPELYDLDPAIYRVQHRPEKAVDGNLVSGFFQHLSSGGSERMLTWIELALWQDPGLVPSQSHDCDARSDAFLQDNSARGQNRRWILRIG